MASPTLPPPTLASKRTTSALRLDLSTSKTATYASPLPSPRSRRRRLVLLIPLLFVSSLGVLAIHFQVVPSPPVPSHLSAIHTRIVDAASSAAQSGGRAGRLLQWLNVAPTLEAISPHPILPLLLGARAGWTGLLAKQPTELAQARTNYQKRWKLPPPNGFDQWYHFARKRNFTLIDEFDGLMQDLARFRGAGGPELRRRTQELGGLSGVSLVSLKPAAPGDVKPAAIEVKTRSGRWAPGTAIKEMLESLASGWAMELDALPENSPIKSALEGWTWPDVELAINERTEGRVLPRREQNILGTDFRYLPDDLAKAALDDPEAHPSLAGFTSEWNQDGNVWDAYRRACPSDSAARRLVDTIRSAEAMTGAIAAGGGAAGEQAVLAGTRRRDSHLNGTAPIPSKREMTFLPGLEAKESFCDRPSTHHLHSAFFTDSRSISHLYPLFSGSKLGGFADILIPTHHHWNPSSEFAYEWELKHGQAKVGQDVAWKDKKSKVYWRGKITRGADTPPGHMSSFQKQRLVKLVSDEKVSPESSGDVALGEADPSRHGDTERILACVNADTGMLSSVSAPAKVVDPLLFDIAMACDPTAGECAHLKGLGYHVEPPAPIGDAWKHKIVLDLDEAGFSPRFGAVMESGSAVVKMSVQLEFWRDWVQPWYHFIPLSSSYAELHSLVTFFVGIPAELVSQAHAIPHRRPLSSSGTNEIDLSGFNADRELKRIADAGKEWKKRHMRKADMEVYMFRLIIEWARLLEEPTVTVQPLGGDPASKQQEQRQPDDGTLQNVAIGNGDALQAAAPANERA